MSVLELAIGKRLTRETIQEAAGAYLDKSDSGAFETSEERFEAWLSLPKLVKKEVERMEFARN